MMRLLKFLLFVAFLIFPSLSNAETIHYKISRFGIGGVGDLTWVGPQQYKGRGTMLVTFKSKGFNFKDDEYIYLDPVTFKPIYVERDLNILGRVEQISEDYTHAGEIILTKTSGGKTFEQRLKVKGEVDNIYGFIYRFRQQGGFKIGEAFDVNLPTKKIRIQLLKETKLSLYGKQYDCYYMQSQPSEYKIWFDMSNKKIPLRIVGGGQMNMAGYEE